MSILIDKNQEYVYLYFTLDRDAMGGVVLNITNDFDKLETKIQLPEPTESNERYTAFSLTNPFTDYADGLYTYTLTDVFGILESGSIKIQSSDFGQPDYPSYINDDDNYITYEGDDY